MLYLYTDISVILSHPESINVTTNSEVEFSCVATANEIIFFVNETSASDFIFANKGFTQLPTDDVYDTTLRRCQTATALTQYDNTEVLCLALIVVSVNPIPSDVAILRIQGKFMNIYNVIVINHFILNVVSHRSIYQECYTTKNESILLHFSVWFIVNRL